MIPFPICNINNSLFRNKSLREKWHVCILREQNVLIFLGNHNEHENTCK